MFFLRFGLSDKEKKDLQNFVDNKIENLNITELGKVSMTLEQARKRRFLNNKRKSKRIEI